MRRIGPSDLAPQHRLPLHWYRLFFLFRHFSRGWNYYSLLPGVTTGSYWPACLCFNWMQGETGGACSAGRTHG
jgi:hypothetical protein